MDVADRSAADPDGTNPPEHAQTEPLGSLLDALTDGLTTGLSHRDRREIHATAARLAAAEAAPAAEPPPTRGPEPARTRIAEPLAVPDPAVQRATRPADHAAAPAPDPSERSLPPAAVVRTAATPVRRRRGRRIAFFLVLAALFAAGVAIVTGTDWLRSSGGRSSAAPSTAASNAARGTPPAPQGTAKPTQFGWPITAGATYYRVRFFRGGREVFEARPTQPRIVLPARWRFAGHAQRLVPGTYHWVVEPGFGARSVHRYGHPIVAADWVAAR